MNEARHQDRRETEAALIRLSHDFAYYMDHWDYDPLVELFTSDARLDRVLEVHVGREEIRAGLAARRRDVLVRHVSTNFHFIHEDANNARGVVYNISYYGHTQTPGHAPVDYAGPGMLLEFHDRYRREASRWLFAERIVRPVMLAPDAPLRTGALWNTDVLRR